MNTNTKKWIGFAQGLIYPIIALVVGNLTIALGAGGELNGTLPPIAALLVSGLLSVVENIINDKTGRALFGAAPKTIKYSLND